MEISDKLRKYIEDSKKFLVTEKDAYKVWKHADFQPGEFGFREVENLLNIFISSGVHIEKYMTLGDILIYMDGIDFYAPVNLNFDLIDEIDEVSPEVEILTHLRNVKEIHFPNCKRICVGRIGIDCPDLTSVGLWRCEHLTAQRAFTDCPNLKCIAHQEGWTLDIKKGSSSLLFAD